MEDYVANADGRVYDDMTKPPQQTFRRNNKDNIPGHTTVDT